MNYEIKKATWPEGYHYPMKVTRDRLEIMIQCLEDTEIDTLTDYGKVSESIRRELLVKFQKKQAERKPKQSFKLKVHEIVVLKKILIQDFTHGVYELNELMQVTTDLDRSV